MKSAIHPSSPLLGNVCILAWAPRYFCEFLWSCSGQYPEEFPSSKSGKKEKKQVFSHVFYIFSLGGWRLAPVLPQAVWWCPPGLWYYSTGASQRQRTTCPGPAVCRLSLSCPPPSSSSHTPAAEEEKNKRDDESGIARLETDALAVSLLQ